MKSRMPAAYQKHIKEIRTYVWFPAVMEKITYGAVSKAKAVELIQGGKVTLNGQIIKDSSLALGGGEYEVGGHFNAAPYHVILVMPKVPVPDWNILDRDDLNWLLEGKTLDLYCGITMRLEEGLLIICQHHTPLYHFYENIVAKEGELLTGCFQAIS